MPEDPEIIRMLSRVVYDKAYPNAELVLREIIYATYGNNLESARIDFKKIKGPRLKNVRSAIRYVPHLRNLGIISVESIPNVEEEDFTRVITLNPEWAGRKGRSLSDVFRGSQSD